MPDSNPSATNIIIQKPKESVERMSDSTNSVRSHKLQQDGFNSFWVCVFVFVHIEIDANV